MPLSLVTVIISIARVAIIALPGGLAINAATSAYNRNEKFRKFVDKRIEHSPKLRRLVDVCIRRKALTGKGDPR